jgi:transposase-like protein
MLNKKNGLSKYKQTKIMWAFAVDLTATQAALMLGFDRKTINRYYGLFRAAIHAHQSRQIAAIVGVVECDESYFGQARPRGVPGPRKRGRGTNKQPVFGIFERRGAVFTEIVPDVKAKTLQGLIRGKVSLESIVMTDGWQAYDGLVDVGYDKHFRIKKYRKEGSPFTDGPVHVNGIESFWSYTKRRLARFNGVKINFELHLKECEWRWGKDPDTILAQLRKLLV